VPRTAGKKDEFAMLVSNGMRLATVACFLAAVLSGCSSAGSAEAFHGAPAAEQQHRNPLGSDAAAVAAGQKTFAATCASCHGVNGEGAGNVPPLASPAVRQAGDGEVFWYITKGDVNNGMPSWAALTEEQRWQLVAFVRTLRPGPAPAAAAPASTAKLTAPPPQAPFTDFRYEAPGTVRKITVADLPPPFQTPSAGNGPKRVDRPADAWPKAPPGFKVDRFVDEIPAPRLLRTAPNGDVFVALTAAGKVALLRGLGANGKPEENATFATGLNRPFGLAFYPPGADPQWLYVGNTDGVVRFAYRNGDEQARGAPEHLADLPTGGHSTRDIQFSPDGKTMYVSVGSKSNVDDPDTTPDEKHRADILAFAPDGSGLRVFASGIRNAVGLAIQPGTSTLWCSVNERDGLGDNLVPDYITHVQDGGFYGWPWWYIGAHQDPRHDGKHRDMMDKIIVPDVLLQPHNASLQLAFYEGNQFPAEYRGDIFAGEHGSWNRSVRTGYEVIRVPLHQSGKASGEYEDFLTGFVLDSGEVWGRPVGVTVASDGSLLVSDDMSNAIWRVSYTAAPAAAGAPH
jgi:glucose/arabinose dehydrogenase/cytochrome c2